MDDNMKKWPQTETGSQIGAFTLYKLWNLIYVGYINKINIKL